jgi:hypothetical protein
MTEPHISEYHHDCPTLYELLPRFYEAPTLTSGIENYRVLSSLLIHDYKQVVECLELLGLDESVMTALREAEYAIGEELACEEPSHHEIFEQFLNDGMKFLPALRAAHLV